LTPKQLGSDHGGNEQQAKTDRHKGTNANGVCNAANIISAIISKKVEKENTTNGYFTYLSVFVA
jgi:hypothetical protein